MPSKQLARTRLEKISRALFESAKEKRRKSNESLRLLQDLATVKEGPYNESYFDAVWQVLKEPQSQSYKRRGLTSNWLSRIKIRLNQKYPDVDHSKILTFLEKCAKLPKKGGVRALKNAFYAFEQQLSIRSIKSYKSRVSKFFKSLSPVSEADLQFSEKEINQMTTEWMRISFGMSAIDSDLDLTDSTLNWEVWGENKKPLSSEKRKRDDE